MTSQRSSTKKRGIGILASYLAVVLAAAGCAIDERTTSVLESRPDDEPPAPECAPDETACASATQRRVCSLDGSWLDAETCPRACVGDDCGGVCVPGEQRCASSSAVQRCSEAGEWQPEQACPAACSGTACAGECLPGRSECASPAQLRRCSDSGQWQAPIACEFTCQQGACAGECTPADVRCDPTSSQRCDEAGAWRDVARCLPGGPCPVGSLDRCADSCISLENDPLNCGACGHDCRGGGCSGGLCQPVVLGSGFINPSAPALGETDLYFREGPQGAGRILRIPKAGGSAEVMAQGVSNLVGVALGGEQLYFASGNAATLGEGQVLRANLDGSEPRPFSPLRAPGIFSLIVPGLNVYYTERSPMSTLVYRAGLLSLGQAGTATEVEFETVPGGLLSMTVNSGCMFYVAQGTPQQLQRKCAPAETAVVHHMGAGGEVAFQPAASTDADYLYFTQGTTLFRIALEPPAAPEALVSGRVAAPSVDSDALYYFAATEDPVGAGCSSAYALYRASKLPGAGAPTLLLPPPIACPTQLVLDETALYWLSGDGSSLLTLAK